MPESWMELNDVLDAGDAGAVAVYVTTLPPSEQARAVAHLDQSHRAMLLSLLGPEEAADLLAAMPEEQAADLLEEATDDAAAEITACMPAARRADVLSEVDEAKAEAILCALPDEAEQSTRALLAYGEDCAGGLMDTEFISCHQKLRVSEVIEDLRENVDTYSDYSVQYVYVVDEAGRLTGVLRLRDLLMAPAATPIAKVMIGDPLHIRDDTELSELRTFYEEHQTFLGVPVTNADGRLVGIVRRSSVKKADQDQVTSAFLKISGVIGGEEFRSMPLTQRSARRLAWLAPNIVLNMIAASVIAMYQDTLQAAIALAVFLPIISDMSGCSGNQAVAVSIRELSLRLIKPSEYLRVLRKEVGMGLINGTALGCLLGGAALLYTGNPFMGLIVGGALALNTLLSVLLGGLVPLLLRGAGIDPALASGPLLTTVTDMCGFFFVLGFATVMLAQIAG